MKNWKTFLASLIAGLPIAFDAFVTAYDAGKFSGQTVLQIVVAVGVILFGVYAKDRNVTGGTTEQPSK